MDQFKKLTSQFGQHHQQDGQQQGLGTSQHQQTNAQAVNQGSSGTMPAGNVQGMQSQGQGQGQEDYLDKGLDFVENKFGHKVDRAQNEKITDGARGMFEKLTGKKVPEKFSN